MYWFSIIPQLLPEVLALLMMYLLKNQSISSGQDLPYFHFYFLKRLPVGFLQFLQTFYIYISAWVGTSFQQQPVNTAVMNAMVMPLSNYAHFCHPFCAKTFSVFGAHW
jgi:hypothetical protein